MRVNGGAEYKNKAKNEVRKPKPHKIFESKNESKNEVRNPNPPKIIKSKIEVRNSNLQPESRGERRMS